MSKNPNLLLMGFSANRQRSLLYRAALLLIISDILLGVYFGIMQYPILHMCYMSAFYTALTLIAVSSASPCRKDGEPKKPGHSDNREAKPVPASAG